MSEIFEAGFTGVVGTALASYTPERGVFTSITQLLGTEPIELTGGGDARIRANATAAVAAYYLTTGGPADFTLIAEIQTGAAGTASSFGLFWKDDGAGTGYALVLNEGTAGLVMQRTAGFAVAATLATVTAGFAANTTYKLRLVVEGSRFRVWRDAETSPIMDQTDTTITATGTQGCFLSNVGSTTQTQPSRIVVNDAAVLPPTIAAPTATVLPYRNTVTGKPSLGSRYGSGPAAIVFRNGFWGVPVGGPTIVDASWSSTDISRESFTTKAASAAAHTTTDRLRDVWSPIARTAVSHTTTDRNLDSVVPRAVVSRGHATTDATRDSITPGAAAAVSHNSTDRARESFAPSWRMATALQDMTRLVDFFGAQIAVGGVLDASWSSTDRLADFFGVRAVQSLSHATTDRPRDAWVSAARAAIGHSTTDRTADSVTSRAARVVSHSSTDRARDAWAPSLRMSAGLADLLRLVDFFGGQITANNVVNGAHSTTDRSLDSFGVRARMAVGHSTTDRARESAVLSTRALIGHNAREIHRDSVATKVAIYVTHVGAMRMAEAFTPRAALSTRVADQLRLVDYWFFSDGLLREPIRGLNIATVTAAPLMVAELRAAVLMRAQLAAAPVTIADFHTRPGNV